MKNNLPNRKYSFKNNESGMALFICINLIATIFAITFAFMLAGLFEMRAAERFENRLAAFHLAEGAVDQTIATLRTNSSYSGLGSTNATGGRINGTYSSAVSSPTTSVYSITGMGNVTTAGGAYAAQTQTVTAVVNLASTSIFKYAVLSNGSFNMSSSSITDGYNSANGAYSNASATSTGNIATNSNSSSAVTMSSSSVVNGNAYIGPSGNVANAYNLTSSSVITGSKSNLGTAESLPAVTIPAGLTSSGALSITSSHQVTLPAGTYYYSSISITSSGKLNLSGPTTIYVSGNVAISGNGIATSSNLPTNLTLKVQGSSVQFTSSATFYGAVYAPSAAISLTSSADVYGALVGNTFTSTSSSKTHYDQALNPSSGSTNSGQLKSWSAT